MVKYSNFILLGILLIFWSCDRSIEESMVDPGFDFQPLEIGNFWIYEVDQTTYFGENDSEQVLFFYRDRIRTFYLNAEKETVYVIERAKSVDRKSWRVEKEYTLIRRDFSLIKTIDNQPLVSFVFPPKIGRVWDGNVYRDDAQDNFEIDALLTGPANGIDLEIGYRVLQEESDDQVTFRDMRYESYAKGIGMIGNFSEVLTYCSRNDCLGDEIIDSGLKTQLVLIEYGKN